MKPQIKKNDYQPTDLYYPDFIGSLTLRMLNDAYGYAGRTFATHEEAEEYAKTRRGWVTRLVDGEGFHKRGIGWLFTLDYKPEHGRRQP